MLCQLFRVTDGVRHKHRLTVCNVINHPLRRRTCIDINKIFGSNQSCRIACNLILCLPVLLLAVNHFIIDGAVYRILQNRSAVYLDKLAVCIQRIQVSSHSGFRSVKFRHQLLNRHTPHMFQYGQNLCKSFLCQHDLFSVFRHIRSKSFISIVALYFRFQSQSIIFRQNRSQKSSSKFV